MESSLDEGLGGVADVNIAMITRLILHIADTQLPVRTMDAYWNFYSVDFRVIFWCYYQDWMIFWLFVLHYKMLYGLG